MNLKSQIDFNELKHIRFAIILFSGIFVFSFLWFFQPFDLNEFNIKYKNLFLAGFGFNTSFVLFLCYYFIPLVWKQFFLFKFWNASYHLIYLMINLLIISLLNRIYGSITGFYDFNPFSVFHYVLYTFSVGLLPIVITIVAVDRILLKLKFEELSNISQKKEILQETVIQNTVTIKSGKLKDQITLLSSDIICFKANDNYVNIFFLQENIVKKRLIRITMSRVEEQLSEYDFIVRCHRSYIININKIISVERESQKYFFTIDKLSISVPVSKTFPENIIDKILEKLKSST